MNNAKDDQEFLKDINNMLNRRVEEIDENTKAALRNIRKAAIAQTVDRTANRWQWLQPVPIIAMASIVLVVSVSLRTMTTSQQQSPALENIPLLTAADDINFYNDLEFYQWLEAEKING